MRDLLSSLRGTLVPHCRSTVPAPPFNSEILLSFRDWDKLWSALTLLTSYSGFNCRLEVTTVLLATVRLAACFLSQG